MRYCALLDYIEHRKNALLCALTLNTPSVIYGVKINRFKQKPILQNLNYNFSCRIGMIMRFFDVF